MWHITIRLARIWLYTKMRPYGESSDGLAALSPSPFWPGYITNSPDIIFGKDKTWRLQRKCLLVTQSEVLPRVAHAGINMLGGRDFDRNLLNSVVRPWLLSNFDLPDDFQKDPTYQRLLRVAQYRCERSKISLSTQQVDRIFADENQLAAKDKASNAIYLDVEITREGLE